jgi:hypothetical protein
MMANHDLGAACLFHRGTAIVGCRQPDSGKIQARKLGEGARIRFRGTDVEDIRSVRQGRLQC